MKLISYIVMAGLTLMLVSCGKNKQQDKYADSSVVSTEKSARGDSTIYGLACDGCTDSVVVLLKYSGGDPETFNILNAKRMHQVYGRPMVGDELAILVDPEDKHDVAMLIDLDELKGTWCYQVLPHMRDIAGMSKRMQRRMQQHMPDSMLKTFMVPKEYGFKLKRDYQSSPIGYTQPNATSDEMSPVEYPTCRWYNEWHIYNGKLILTQNASKLMLSNAEQKIINDTAEILMLRNDTLALKFNDGTIIGYYNKEKDRGGHRPGQPMKK